MHNRAEASEAELRRTLETLYDSQDVIELRVPDGKRTQGGYFRDRDALIQAAISLNSNTSCYLCLNPCPLELYPRRADRIAFYDKGGATSDRDIEVRRWLLIDLDVVRKVGTSSTDEAKEVAYGRCAAVWQHLVQDLGWPEPIIADSGNGYHILPRLADFPNDSQHGNLCKALLSYLDKRFTDSAVKIDVGMSNAARIVQAYGCVNRKGDDVPGWPHRLSKLIHVPAEIRPVTADLIAALVGAENTGSQPPPPEPDPTPGDDWITVKYSTPLREILDRKGIEYSEGERESNIDHRMWYSYRFDCWKNPDHRDSAWALQSPQHGQIVAGCSHDSCKSENADSMLAAWHVRRGSIHQEVEFSEPLEPPCGHFQTLLFSRITPRPIDWLWKNRIPFGKLVLLAGAGGIGKTFLICDLVARVSSGLLFCDGGVCRQADVLLISAEDDEEDTLHPRLTQMSARLPGVHWFEGVVSPLTRKREELSILRHIAEFDRFLTDHPGVRLVVMDPITAFMDSADGNSNSAVRGVLQPLAKLIKKHRVAFVGISHIAKSIKDKDRPGRVLGSVGFVNAARVVWGVELDPTDRMRRLFIPLKANLKVSDGLAFTIRNEAIVWDEQPLPNETSTRKRDKLDTAMEFLIGLMPLNVELAAGEILAAAVENGIHERTLRRAARQLGVSMNHGKWTRPECA